MMFTWRLCTDADRDVWTQLNKAFMDEEIQDDALWNNTNQEGDDSFYHTFSEALNSEELISLLLFEEDGKPVGFANLMTIFSIWAHGKAIILDDLYIIPEARGKGYGKKALQFVEKYAKDRKYKRLQFQSEATNPNAMEFYVAMGYAPADMKFYVKYFK